MLVDASMLVADDGGPAVLDAAALDEEAAAVGALLPLPLPLAPPVEDEPATPAPAGTR